MIISYLYIVPVLSLIIPVIPLLILYKKTGLLIKPLIVGMGLLMLTLIVQPSIQYLPIQVLKIDLGNPSPTVIVPLFLYISLVSGFFQECLKYIVVRSKDVLYALWVGGGFGLGEALFIAFNQFIALLAGISFSFTLGLLAVYERFNALIYHMFSTGLLSHYASKGRGMYAYIVLAIVHSLMNFQAIVLTKMYGYLHMIYIIVYGIITITSLSILMYYLKVVRNG